MKEKDTGRHLMEELHIGDVGDRIILNVDSVGIHLRTNECTIHHAESGEVKYHCRPLRSIYGKFWKWVLLLVIKYGR